MKHVLWCFSVNIKVTFKEPDFSGSIRFLPRKNSRSVHVISMWKPIKVNDKIGNPILIGLVLVWKLKDTYKAMFEIDSQTMAASGKEAAANAGNAIAGRMNAFENFVKIQSDAALRQVAGQYAYDDNEGETG